MKTGLIALVSASLLTSVYLSPAATQKDAEFGAPFKRPITKIIQDIKDCKGKDIPRASLFLLSYGTMNDRWVWLIVTDKGILFADNVVDRFQNYPNAAGKEVAWSAIRSIEWRKERFLLDDYSGIFLDADPKPANFKPKSFWLPDRFDTGWHVGLVQHERLRDPTAEPADINDQVLAELRRVHSAIINAQAVYPRGVPPPTQPPVASVPPAGDNATNSAPPAATGGGTASQDLAEKLKGLKKLREEGLITEEEYDKKRKELLDKF